LTTIPNRIAQGIQLRQISELPTRNADGSQTPSPIYVADVEFEGFSFASVSVAGTNLPIALVGRDLLTALVAIFDGPALNFSLSRP